MGGQVMERGMSNVSNDACLTDEETFDRSAAVALASYIRQNVSALAEVSNRAFAREYPHSVLRRRVSSDRGTAWGRSLFLASADALEHGGIVPFEEVTRPSDIVIQADELFNPVAVAIETLLFNTRMIAITFMSSELGDFGSLDAALGELSSLVRRSVTAYLKMFLSDALSPGSLYASWNRSLVQPTRQDDLMRDDSTGSVYDNEVDSGVERSLRELTPRELQFAQLVSAGRSNKEIADELGVSLSTVKNTLGRVFMKLGVGSRTELATLVARSA